MSKLAVLFPGQGSQKVGMLSDVAERFSSVKTLYAKASDILAYDLWDIVLNGPSEKLNETQYTQPALFVADLAMWALYLEHGGAKPAFFAGHSLGEYAALCAGNAFSFEDGVKLVADRARFMQEAVPVGEGAMAVIIGLPIEAVQAVCEKAAEGDIVAPANMNETMQTVIAGSSLGIDRAMSLAKEAGAKLVKRLPVSVPSHSVLMKPAAERLAETLNNIDIKMPDISVINNVDVKVNSDPEAIRDALLRQICMPVRWAELLAALVAKDVDTMTECGPGKVLTGLSRRMDPHLKLTSINNLSSLEKLTEGVS